MGISLPIRQVWSTAKRVGAIAGQVVDETFKAATVHTTVWKNPAVKPAPATFLLRLVSYNVLKGPQNFDAVVAELRAQKPDVACLQEVYGKDQAVALAKALGMHVAFFPNNKAVLSRYPIQSAQNHGFDVGLGSRLSDAWSSGQGEPIEARSAGVVTLKVGGKTLDVVDTHLSLYSTRANAAELRQLDALLDAREKQGHSVLLAGDFNTNFAQARPGAADARGQAVTPTDTWAEFEDRYGGKATGNMKNADDRAAARALLAGRTSHWDEGEREMQVGGRTLSPEAALAELQSGKVKPGSAKAKELWRAVDGISHPGAGKRFDNVIASKDLRFVSTFVDGDSKASDHRPVVTLVTPR